MKGIIFRNIRWWLKQPIFDDSGLLTIGYRYPNLKMAEFYNAPGSPAWAMKAFLVLALPETHPFWTAEEMELPKLAPLSCQKHPFMLLMRNDSGSHVQALTAGQYARFEPTFMAAKYEKFAYSNVFGFSVPGGDFGLDQGAYDSILALCEQGDSQYRVRRRCEKISIHSTHIYSVWSPWADVEIHTWLIPCEPWHVRVHRILSRRNLHGGEGAYAINCDAASATVSPGGYDAWEELLADSSCARAAYPWAATGIVNLEGFRTGTVITAHPNTNILYCRTKLPTLVGDIPAGETWLSCAVLGTPFQDQIPGAKGSALQKLDILWRDCPQYHRNESTFEILFGGTRRTFTEE